MKVWHLGVVSIAVLVLAACEQKKPEPAMQPEKDNSLSQMDNPPPATMDPYATDPYARNAAARPTDQSTGGAKKAPAKASTKEEPPAPKSKAATGKTYVIQKGDTLSSIAQKFYGDSKKWKVIWDANKKAIPNKDKLTVGTKITIP